MRVRRFFLCSSAMALFGGVIYTMLAATAAAQISGPCTATMNGRDVNSISTTGTALEVPYNGTVSVNYVSSGAITGHDVKLEFGGGFPWTVASGKDDGNSWSDSVSVDKYSKYGVGLYRVTGDTLGAGACSGSAFVKVTGKSPLSTAAGVAGAVLAALGMVGMFGSAVSVAGKGPQLARKMDEGAMAGLQGEMEAERDIDRALKAQAEHPEGCIACAVALPLAMLQTVAFMLVGAGTLGAPVVVIRWRPCISVISTIGSLLAGLGTLVLSQQYALFFPTRIITIIWLMVWLVIGIAIPSLARLIAIRKANAILAQKTTQRPTEPEQEFPQQ